MNESFASDAVSEAMNVIASIDIPDSLVKAVRHGMGIQANRVYEAAAASPACGLFGVDVLLAVSDHIRDGDSTDCIGMLEAYKHGFAIAAAMLVDADFIEDVDILLEALPSKPKDF